MHQKRIVKYTIRFTKQENEFFTKNMETALISSKADYLRRLALNNVIYSKTDNQNFLKFLKIAGQQGKLVGLLRIFIMEYSHSSDVYNKILSIIDELIEFKKHLKILSDKIL